MSKYYDIKWDEMKKLANIFVDIADMKWLREIANQARDIMLEDARRNCPVETGKLKNSLKCEVVETGDGFSVILSTEVKYAEFIEYGTIHIKVGTPNNPIPSVKASTYRPFLRPSLIKAVKFVEKEIERYLKEKLEEL